MWLGLHFVTIRLNRIHPSCGVRLVIKRPFAVTRPGKAKPPLLFPDNRVIQLNVASDLLYSLPSSNGLNIGDNVNWNNVTMTDPRRAGMKMGSYDDMLPEPLL